MNYRTSGLWESHILPYELKEERKSVCRERKETETDRNASSNKASSFLKPGFIPTYGFHRYLCILVIQYILLFLLRLN